MTAAPGAGTATAKVDGDAVMIQQVRVAIERGTDPGRHIVSRSARVVIGSQAGVDLVLDDPAVSRFHCEIAIDGGRARLRDLGSRNGTSVDGVVVRDADLHAGAKILVGRTRLRFEVEPDHVRIPVSERRSFGRLVGATPAMRAVFAILERAAAGDATVLLEGETGTGKDAAAESIHEQSARRAKPLRVIDCGALPAQLIESELFGHERGAFTGAAAARAGAFEAADGGTVFLDEIGELPIELQPKLLRVLERREVKRLGATEHRAVDVRVIAATNRDLREEINARRFRPDLYWRLAVVTVVLPPLRDRSEDLPLLVDNLVAAYPRCAPRCARRSSWQSSRGTPGRATFASCATTSTAAPRSAPSSLRRSRVRPCRAVMRPRSAPHGRCARLARTGRATPSAATSRICCAGTPTTSQPRPGPPASTARTSIACSGSTTCGDRIAGRRRHSCDRAT